MKNDEFFINAEPFFDNEMMTLYTKTTDFINNELEKGLISTSLKIGYSIDEEKLKKWIERCVKLDNIDKDTTIDIAIQKKFKQLQNEIEFQKNRPNPKLEKLKREVFYYCPPKSITSLEYANGYHDAMKKIYSIMQELEGEDE